MKLDYEFNLNEFPFIQKRFNFKYKIRIEKHQFIENEAIIELTKNIDENRYRCIRETVSFKNGQLEYNLLYNDFANMEDMKSAVNTILESGLFKLIRITSPGNTHIFTLTQKGMLELI